MELFGERDTLLMITCEHVSNSVPAFLKKRFSMDGMMDPVLNTHHGYDIGAYEIYKRLLGTLRPDFSRACGFSRLVADANRSLESDELFFRIYKKFGQYYDR